MARGGARPGAGRPMAGNVKKLVSLHPGMANHIEELAERFGVTQSVVLDKALTLLAVVEEAEAPIMGPGPSPYGKSWAKFCEMVEESKD